MTISVEPIAQDVVQEYAEALGLDMSKWVAETTPGRVLQFQRRVEHQIVIINVWVSGPDEGKILSRVWHYDQLRPTPVS